MRTRRLGTQPASLGTMPADLPDDCVRLLDFQRGVIARSQFRAVGLDPRIIETMLRSSRWQPLYRGVYAAYTGDPPREGLQWAAVLRAGGRAALSHYTAAELDGLADKPSEVIHVTVGHDRRVRISREERHEQAPRVVIHRTDRIDAVRHPVRSPPRTRIEETVLDLTQHAATFDAAFSWLCRGCGRRLVTTEQLRAALHNRKRFRWRAEVLWALGSVADGVHSNLELRYVRDIEHAHSLPTAKRQAKTVRASRSQYFDNLYKAFGVAVELDGQAAHLIEDRWRDIYRDNFGARSGIITLRFSWADVTYRPCEVAAVIADVLRLRGWEGLPCQCGPRCTATASFGQAGLGPSIQRGRVSANTVESRPR